METDPNTVIYHLEAGEFGWDTMPGKTSSGPGGVTGRYPAMAALPGVPETGRHPYLGDAVCLLVQRRLSCSPVMGMTVTEERLKQRGYHSFKDYYHHVRPKMPAP